MRYSSRGSTSTIRWRPSCPPQLSPTARPRSSSRPCVEVPARTGRPRPLRSVRPRPPASNAASTEEPGQSPPSRPASCRRLCPRRLSGPRSRRSPPRPTASRRRSRVRRSTGLEPADAGVVPVRRRPWAATRAAPLRLPPWVRRPTAATGRSTESRSHGGDAVRLADRRVVVADVTVSRTMATASRRPARRSSPTSSRASSGQGSPLCRRRSRSRGQASPPGRRPVRPRARPPGRPARYGSADHGSTSRHVARRTGRAPPRPASRPRRATLDECSIMSASPRRRVAARIEPGRRHVRHGVYVHVKPERVADFIDSMRDNYEHSVLEPGNLRFDILSRSTIQPIHPTGLPGRGLGKAHKDTAHYVAWRRRWPTGWPSRARGVRYDGLFRRSSRTEKATTMKSNGPVEAGGHPERGAIASAAEVGRVSRSHVLARILFGPGRSGSWLRSSGNSGRGRWSSSAARPSPSCGLGQAAGRARIGGSGSLGRAVPGEPSPALVDEIVARHGVNGPWQWPASGSGPASGPARSTSSSGSAAGSVLDTAKAVAGLLIPGRLRHGPPSEGIGSAAAVPRALGPVRRRPNDGRDRQRGRPRTPC